MKLKVLACGVFEPELRALSPESPHEIVLHLLDAGLHARPDQLRHTMQAAIDAASNFDAVVLVYGLCGRGTAGLVARDVPVVMPRVHDCLTLFLGSRAEYRRQFERHPGTFYITAGWYEHKVAPGQRQPRQANRARRAEDDPRFAKWAEKYGEENARAIITFYDSWKRNYTRAAFIDTGLGRRDIYEAHARDMAEEFGWLFERLRGHTQQLRALLNGQWDRPDILVLRPAERSVATGDDRVLDRIEPGPPARAHATSERAQTATDPARSRSASTVLPRGSAGHSPRAGTLAVGIDAGGTFTDAVLLDPGAGDVLAKAKAPTTHHDLLVGVDEALSRLQIPRPDAVNMVAISTTLATNAIAEGKGGLPGAVIMTLDGRPDPRINWRPQRVLSARMTIGGEVRAPVDRDECLRAIDELVQAGVEAFAVSGYGSVRNPAHELQVREIIASQYDLPVVCGHELSTRLNYVSRFNTAVLNARLLPVIRSLLEAAKQVLRKHGLRAPLMVVKGDGSLIAESLALERPVETVLSGPAASVAGALYLTGEPDATVMDMGGTTTDTAVVEGGIVRICPDGANVGGWRTHVGAAEIQTTGLGGDSHVRFTPDRVLLVGPRRVIPLCCLAEPGSAAEAQLLRMRAEDHTDRGSADPLDFFALARSAGRSTVGESDARILQALRDGPMSRGALTRHLGLASPSLLRTENLERRGWVQRSALTPTDVLHATGEYTAHNVRAARHALEVFAGLFGRPAEHVGRLILSEVVRRLCMEAVRRELDDRAAEDPGRDLGADLIQAALSRRERGALAFSLEYRRPIVAIGAPVGAFFPDVGRRLNARMLIPPHAEVGNAIGAVASQVIVREAAVIRPGEVANYVFHWREGLREFDDLDRAIASAREVLADLAARQALRAGAAEPKVRVDVNERRGYLANGDLDLIEVNLEAVAVGRPAAL